MVQGDIMATIEERRKADRKRQKRWRKRKLAEGNKQTLLMLTPKAQKVLKREKRRTGASYGQIINRAIIRIEEGHPSISIKQIYGPMSNKKKYEGSEN
jgi:hypothetical protein